MCTETTLEVALVCRCFSAMENVADARVDGSYWAPVSSKTAHRAEHMWAYVVRPVAFSNNYNHPVARACISSRVQATGAVVTTDGEVVQRASLEASGRVVRNREHVRHRKRRAGGDEKSGAEGDERRHCWFRVGVKTAVLLCRGRCLRGLPGELGELREPCHRV